MPSLRLLKYPFQLMGRAGKAAEMAFPSVFHPEQILSLSPRGKQTYELMVKQARLTNLAKEHFKMEERLIFKKYGLNTEEKMNQFLSALELPFFKQRMPTKEEFNQFPREIWMAASEHLQKVTDPIWRIAKVADPKIGYLPGYFTHFPVKSVRLRLEDEIKRITENLAELEDIPQNFAIRQGFEKQLVQLQDRFRKISHADDSMNALRYQQLPKGGHFGPLNEERQAQHMWNYRRDVPDVMEEYIDGAMRKVFLDRVMKPATKLMKSEPNEALRQYMFDYITAQRGALASKRRIFLNESLAQLFPDPEGGYRGVAKAVDYVTRFQYLSKIGLSWFRFPVVNATQPLLTTYPMVGGKNFLLGYKDALTNTNIWKEAKDVGVLFEATLRKGVTELLGRGTKLSAWERGVSWPAKFSEELNRVVTYAAGLRQAGEKGLRGKEAVEHAIKLVNRTQFLYHKEALPLFMSQSPAGRLIFQFRTFTANYVNFLTQLVREKNHAGLARAVGSLMALSGTAAIPFNIWDTTRKKLLRSTGVDIGEVNPIEWGTEKMGISPPVSFGSSLEPFNVPSNLYQVFGPTAGPILEWFFESMRRPEEAEETFWRQVERISPPVTALGRGLFFPTVRMRPTKEFPQGREIGRRSVTETMFARPSLETTRRKYVELMANALAGGNIRRMKELQVEAQKMGLTMGEEDLTLVKARATRLKQQGRVATWFRGD